MKKSSKSLGCWWIRPILPPRFCVFELPNWNPPSLVNPSFFVFSPRVSLLPRYWPAAPNALPGASGVVHGPRHVQRQRWSLHPPGFGWSHGYPQPVESLTSGMGLARWDWCTGYDGYDAAAQGGGRSFTDRKPIGEVSSCDAWMAERTHWWTQGGWGSTLSLSLSLSLTFFPYLSLSLSFSLSLSICLPICSSISPTIFLSI